MYNGCEKHLCGRVVWQLWEY